jgi:hypothetical protein
MDAREMGSGFSNGEWLCCSLFVRDQLTRHLKTCSLVRLITNTRSTSEVFILGIEDYTIMNMLIEKTY